MRKIKLRGWNAGAKQMIYSPPVECRNGILVLSIYNDDGMLVKAPLMEYTGLNDSNGNEIYDGDIVSDHVGIGVIEYVDRHAAFRVNYRNGRAKWFYDYNLQGEIESIEVIGNIYQNPELIDKKN